MGLVQDCHWLTDRLAVRARAESKAGHEPRTIAQVLRTAARAAVDGSARVARFCCPFSCSDDRQAVAFGSRCATDRSSPSSARRASKRIHLPLLDEADYRTSCVAKSGPRVITLRRRQLTCKSFMTAPPRGLSNAATGVSPRDRLLRLQSTSEPPVGGPR
jgi:hypothetical protein